MNAREMFKSLGYKRHESENGIQYFSESVEITFIFLIRRFYKQENFQSLNISVDEFKAIQQQMKELGWIAKEEKQETNYEHYKDKIIEDGIWNLALVNGTPKRCHNVYCNDCDFKTSRECKKKLEEWLKHPYKKLPYKLSQFEFDIIQTYRDCHESCKISEFKQLIELKDKGYFKCIDHDTKIQDVLKNCEVIQ